MPRPKVKRKSGAQPGNINALKHGFYSPRFNDLEIKDLATILTANLEDDIAVLRVCIRRMFDLATKDAKTLDDWATVNFAVGSSATRIGGLKRVQHLLSGGQHDLLGSLVLERIEVVGSKIGLF